MSKILLGISQLQSESELAAEAARRSTASGAQAELAGTDPAVSTKKKLKESRGHGIIQRKLQDIERRRKETEAALRRHQEEIARKEKEASAKDKDENQVTESSSDIKKKMSKYEELAIKANRTGDDEKCKMYQKKVQELKQKLSQGVAEGSEQSFKVTYDIYGSNKEKPLYTKSRTVRANSEQEAISILRKLVGGTNYRVEKQGVAEGSGYIGDRRKFFALRKKSTQELVQMINDPATSDADKELAKRVKDERRSGQATRDFNRSKNQGVAEGRYRDEPEYEVYQAKLDDQFDFIGDALHSTDDLGDAHVYAHKMWKLNPEKMFVIWQERTSGNRGGYGPAGSEMDTPGKAEKEAEMEKSHHMSMHEEEVVEGSRVKTPSGYYKDLDTGRLYSSPTGQDGNDSYMTPSYMLAHYKKKLSEIPPGRYPKDVAQLKSKIAKLEKQGLAEGVEGWEVDKEINGVKRISTKEVQGNTIKKIEVWNVGKTGHTMHGSPAAGSWKTRGYKVNDKFYRQYKDAVAAAKTSNVAEGTDPRQIPGTEEHKLCQMIDDAVKAGKNRLANEYRRELNRLLMIARDKEKRQGVRENKNEVNPDRLKKWKMAVKRVYPRAMFGQDHTGAWYANASGAINDLEIARYSRTSPPFVMDREQYSYLLGVRKNQNKNQSVKEGTMTRKQKDQAVRRWFAHDPDTGEKILDIGKKDRGEQKAFALAKREIETQRKKEQSVAEASDISGLLAASHLNRSFIITADLAEGGTKKFRVRAQSERVAREKFAQHHSMAKIVNVEEEGVTEDLHKWFKEKWVRFNPQGKIMGPCARGDDSEGKPKCLPQAKAHSLGKKGRASAAARKRREDPNPERSGPAKNVATKKQTSESMMDKCPHCGGEMVSEELMNEKKDACYYKVKSRYKVWPSAYASGALVKCRKKGAKNWGIKEAVSKRTMDYSVWSQKSRDEQAFLKQVYPDLKIVNAPKPSMPKKEKIDYQVIARKIEAVVGETFPDGDPIDWLYPYMQKRWGITNDAFKHINLAAKKYLNKGGYYKYLETSWDDFADDNPDNEMGVTRESNPWRTSKKIKEEQDTSNVDTSEVLRYLRRATQDIVKSDAYTSDQKYQFQRMFEWLRKPLMDGDMEGFWKEYDYWSGQHPDLSDELMQNAFEHAGLGQDGTIDEFIQKCSDDKPEIDEGVDMTGEISIKDGIITKDGKKIGTVSQNLKHGYHPTVILSLDNGFKKEFEMDQANKDVLIKYIQRAMAGGKDVVDLEDRLARLKKLLATYDQVAPDHPEYGNVQRQIDNLEKKIAQLKEPSSIMKGIRSL